MTSPYAEVIGDPIAQSRSPAIHRFWLDALGNEADYRAVQVTRATFKAYLSQRRGDLAWRGCNVTMPLKLDALFAADERTDIAAAAGAANLLIERDGRLVADNKDVGAIQRVLQPLSRTSITVLGNGGAARAVLMALKLLEAPEVRLQARDMAKAGALGLEFGLRQRPRPFTAPVDSVGLVNATPIGMAGSAPVHIDISPMPKDGWVLDLVTAPLPTPLLTEASARGLITIDGLSVLVDQAADSFYALFGCPPPRDRDRQLFAMLRA
ncbi:MAG: shikimate dehydrogenase [Sphingomicrobium sp.]